MALPAEDKVPLLEASRVLLCDHRGEGLMDFFGRLAASGFQLEKSVSLRETRERALNGSYELLLVEPLTRGGSVELEQIDSLREGLNCGVLIVAPPDDPLPTVLAAGALRSGPWDLIYRNAPLEEFVMRLERLQAGLEGQAELAEMRYLAAHDDRTELLRPRPFQDRLAEHFSAASRHRFDLALVLLDLDDFGRINKDHDHTVGDTVIEHVGAAVRSALRAEDLAGRIGGDEFAALLPYTRRVDAARVVNRLRARIQTLTGEYEGGNGTMVHLDISASIGLESFDGSDLESVEQLRRNGERALRRAKESGGNRAVYYRSMVAHDTASRDLHTSRLE